MRAETWASLRRQMLHRAANRQQGQPSNRPALDPQRPSASTAATGRSSVRAHAGQDNHSGPTGPYLMPNPYSQYLSQTAREDAQQAGAARAGPAADTDMPMMTDAEEPQAPRASSAPDATADPHSEGPLTPRIRAALAARPVREEDQGTEEWYQHMREQIRNRTSILHRPPPAIARLIEENQRRLDREQAREEDAMDIEAGGSSAAAQTDASGGGSPPSHAPDSSDNHFLDRTWQQLQSTMFQPGNGPPRPPQRPGAAAQQQHSPFWTDQELNAHRSAAVEHGRARRIHALQRHVERQGRGEAPASPSQGANGQSAPATTRLQLVREPGWSAEAIEALGGRALQWRERALVRERASGVEPTQQAPHEPHLVQVGNLC